MATAPEDSNHIPAWKDTSFLEPDAIKTKGVQSDPARPKDIPHTAQVQASPQVVSSTSEEMAAHSTALHRLFHAAADLEVAEKDERDALEKAAVLTAVKQQCLQARDDAKRALAAAGRSCRLAAEAHHAELLRQLAASTASLAASLAATTSDDDDLRATPFDAVTSTSPSTVTAAPTSTPTTTTTSTATTRSVSTTTSAAVRSPASLHPSDAAPSPSLSPARSPPTGSSTNPVSIVEHGAILTPSVAATTPLAGATRTEVTDMPFMNASVEDVRQADGLDRLATEEISFAATRVLRFCSARESTAITVAAVVDRAATNPSGDFSCAVGKLVVALQRFHANTEHSWFSSPSPAAASGMLPPFPSPRITSSSSVPNHSRPPIITVAATDSAGIGSPQRVRCSSTSRSHRTESSSSNVNSCSDDNAAVSAAYVPRRRHRDDHRHLRRPANAAGTTASSISGYPHDDYRPYRTAPAFEVSGNRRHISDINSTAAASVASGPCGRRDGGSAGRTRLRCDDSRDRIRRGNTRDRLRRDDSRDRSRRDSTRDRSHGESNRGQPLADGGRGRFRADNNRGQRRADNNWGQLENDDFWGRPRDERNRDGARSVDTGERTRGDSNREQPRYGDGKDRSRGSCNKDRPRANNDDRPRANNDDRPRTNNNDRPRANNDDRPHTNNDDRPRANNDERSRANIDDRPRANNDNRPRANNEDRSRTNIDDRPRANNDDRPRTNITNRDRPRDDTRDRHQQLGGSANGLDDRHIRLKTDSDGASVRNRGRRGHRWGVKGKAPISGFAFAFASSFASGSGSGNASTTPSTSKRPASPFRLASTRPPQRPRCRVEDYPSSSSDSFDVALSQPTLSSNSAVVVASRDGAATRPLLPSDAACAQRAVMDDATESALESSSVHAVEQAYVGIGMR